MATRQREPQPMMDKIKANVLATALIGVGSALGLLIWYQATSVRLYAETTSESNRSLIEKLDETQRQANRTLDRVVLLQEIQTERIDAHEADLRALDHIRYMPENNK